MDVPSSSLILFYGSVSVYICQTICFIHCAPLKPCYLRRLLQLWELLVVQLASDDGHQLFVAPVQYELVNTYCRIWCLTMTNKRT